ncbi:MAG: sigma-54 dependent transcriptional regulator [bacterium]|nr:sigma-54 dependent transcriptional regulator [bacterium]MBU1917429.1 sigma-54 dependent transcriptional regulator [bacterium]
MKKLLIIDDDVAVTNYLMVFFMQTEAYESTVINDSRDIPEILSHEIFDVILLDMDMPHLNGLDILKLLKEKNIKTPVVILSGVNDVDLAVKALKLGAFDFLTKPVDDNDLLDVLTKAMQQRKEYSRINKLPEELKKEDLKYKEAFEYMPVVSSLMIRIFHQAEKMAVGDLSVFIIGDQGTGKKHLAKAIHEASPRKKKSFVAVDLAAYEKKDMAEALFGIGGDWKGERQATPGFMENAEGGTLFIDNMDLLTLPLQIRLNRVIRAQEFYREYSTKIQKIDVRILAASNYDLSSEEYAERFSQEFINHLMVHSIKLPSLKERREDILLIAEQVLNREVERTGKEIKGFDEKYKAFLMRYEFPGNMRELKDIIANSVINEEGEMLNINSLSPYVREK